MDIIDTLQTVIMSIWNYINQDLFTIAGITFSFWDVFVCSIFLSIAGMVIVNLFNTGKG